MSDLTPAPSPPELRDAHGFLVPHNLVTKYRALQTRQQQGEITSANWPELLEQAKRKSYRVGGPLPPKFAQAVSDGIPHQHRPAAWMLLSGAAARKEAQPQLRRHKAPQRQRSRSRMVQATAAGCWCEHDASQT